MRLNRPDLGTGFVGLKHYRAMADDPSSGCRSRTRRSGSPARWRASLLLGLAAALALNRGLPGSAPFGVLMLFPWFLPNVVAGHMWALMLDPRLGVINDMLVKIGVLE